MPALTDRQRIELAIPAYLLYALTAVPGLFAPADPSLAARAEADIAAMRAKLRAACLEPFTDLEPKKRQAMVRRLERVAKGVIAGWHDQSALSLVLTLWYSAVEGARTGFPATVELHHHQGHDRC